MAINIVYSNCIKGDREKSLQPSEFCENKAEIFINSSDANYRKKSGQFFTPIKIARFMAMFAFEDNIEETFRLLDPGAGTGILSCAVCEMLAQNDGIKSIEVDAYENEYQLMSMINYLILFFMMKVRTGFFS